MRNVLRVFKRDLRRICKAPAILAVLLFLAVLPSLYTWFNVYGFWNPYDNTQNLRVCVVNLDEGAENDLMGSLDLGSQIVEQLETNDQLGWAFTGYDEAMAEVESGEAYAAFIIPSDFSYDITTLLTGDFVQPKLEYYVNEKLGPVSPKITDTGASTLDNTINNQFVSTVSQIVAQSIDDVVKGGEGSLAGFKDSVSQGLVDTVGDLREIEDSIGGLQSAASQASAKAADAKSMLQQSKEQLGNLSAGLSDVSSLALDLSQKISSFGASTGTAVDQGMTAISRASAIASSAIGKVCGNLESSQTVVQGAADYAKTIVDSNAAAIEKLKAAAGSVPEDQRQLYDDAVAALEAANASLSSQTEGLKSMSSNISDGAERVSTAASKADDAVQQAVADASGFNEEFSANTFPAIIQGVTTIGTASAQLSTAISNQTILLDQGLGLLDQMQQALDTSADALSQTRDLVGQLGGDLDTVATDALSFGTSQALADLLGTDGSIDPDKIAEFMSSPTEVETEQLYPLNAYGSAMAPLFINLTLWIGVFMLMVIIRLEVDEDGIEDLTTPQRFMGRWMLLALLCTIQAIICVAGCLAMGVQTVNVPMFYLTAVLCSLTYLSVQYTLSTTFQHVGKGLCVILVFLQIPAATGLYPVELTTPFFQAVYPLFPFTYGINAMRETICGFYGTAWLQYMGIMGVFWAVFLALGLLVRPLFSNLNILFAKQLEASDLVNCEPVSLPMRRVKLMQVLRTLSGREEYRAPIAQRACKFMIVYPKLKMWAGIVGVVVPVVFTAVVSFTIGEKIVILCAWLAWLCIVILFLLIVESIKENLERRTILGGMASDELKDLFDGLGEVKRRRKREKREGRRSR